MRVVLDSEQVVMMIAEPVFGMVMLEMVTVHAQSECAGEYCALHNPSDHPLRDAPMVLRLDKGALIERTCEHGVGHSDPDSVAFFTRIGKDPEMFDHSCDGCCQ